MNNNMSLVTVIHLHNFKSVLKNIYDYSIYVCL